MNVDRDAVRALLTRARREVDEGRLPSVQIALAHRGELVAFETYGDATDESRYVVFSATKAFMAGAVWALIGDGLIDVSRRVAEYVPEFATNGKDEITIEQVMLHTCGFPNAPLATVRGDTSAGRCAAFAKWRTEFVPGTVYQYHPTAAHWVLAEVIERVTGDDFRTVVEQRVTTPAGLPRVLGDVPHRALELVPAGEPATADELVAAFGSADGFDRVDTAGLLSLNDPANQRVGLPGGGGVMRACDLAMYYQSILNDDGTIWDPAVLRDATTNVRNMLPDVFTGVPASRTLGLVRAGDDGRSHLRGMGRTVSGAAFGHNGARGQLAWGDPATGLSLGYCTNGLEEHQLREPRRTTAIASLAGACVA